MSCVLNGFNCLGNARCARAPPKLDGGEWKVAVGDVETLIRWANSGLGIEVAMF